MTDKDKVVDDKLEKIKRNMKKEDILDDDAPLTEEEIARQQRIAEEADKLANEESVKAQGAAMEMSEDGFMQVKQEKADAEETVERPEVVMEVDESGFMQVKQDASAKEAAQTPPKEVPEDVPENALLAEVEKSPEAESVQEIEELQDTDSLTPSMFSQDDEVETSASMFSFDPTQEMSEDGILQQDEMDENTALENAMAMARDSLAQSGEWKDPFEEIKESAAVKKYIVYVNRDFVDRLDSMDTDTRNAYVNESLQIKTDLERGSAKRKAVEKTFKHIVITLATIVVGTPVVFFLVNKSIDLTLSNYDYVQRNFEALYKQRADRSRAIQRVNMNLGN